MSSVNAGHYVLGTEGLALLRGWLVADGPQLMIYTDRPVVESSGGNQCSAPASRVTMILDEPVAVPSGRPRGG